MQGVKLLNFIHGISVIYLQFLCPKHMQQKCSPYTHNLFNLPFAFEMWLCRTTPWILTGETPMLSRVQLSFFFGDSFSKKSSADANSSCELSISIISVMFFFSHGLVNFSSLITHCLHNLWPGNTSLNPFSFSILAISRLITLWV